MKSIHQSSKLCTTTNHDVLNAVALAWTCKKKSSSRTKIGTCTRVSSNRKGTKTIRRIRRSVSWVYEQLGSGYWTRAYRMSYEAFESLYQHILPGLREVAVKNSISMSFEDKEQYAYKPPNGPILPRVRLACAIRYFAGGSAYDIALTYGISCSAVHDSVSIVVDAINHYSPALAIKFPEDHDDQQRVAAGFLRKSEAGFSTVVGALDGLLIWIHKPSEDQCRETKVGAKKYLCGRKKKFGLNMQAICDAEGRFLDVSILFGGASSDLIAFEASEIIQKLRTPGFLAPGLHIVADNAYVNTIFMATPYPNVKNGSKDAYNFYHSQLRIKIECAFGMLVHRWGILQKPMSSKFSISKVIAIMLCLCKLHNYCINARLASPASTATDALNIAIRNGISINRRTAMNSNQNEVSTAAEELMGGGDHFDDVPRSSRHTIARLFTGDETVLLPREILHNIVLEKGLCRPAVVHNRE